MANIIKIEGLDYKHIFNYFCLEIEKNTLISLIGPNGSGKSTLIKAMIGYIKTKGYINVDNYYVDDRNIKEVRKTFGVVFDRINDNLVGETVLDNLTFTLNNLQYDEEEIKYLLKEVCDNFNLNNILNKKVSNLTNSEKQKVAIASIIICKPKIIILDDCINQLTRIEKDKLFEILKQYKKKYKTTIILVTHDLEDTINSDRIIVLDKGKIVLDDTPFKVYKKYDKIKSLGFKLPFMIELSLKLMNLNLIDHIYLDKGKLVDDLWK